MTEEQIVAIADALQRARPPGKHGWYDPGQWALFRRLVTNVGKVVTKDSKCTMEEFRTMAGYYQDESY